MRRAKIKYDTALLYQQIYEDYYSEVRGGLATDQNNMAEIYEKLGDKYFMGVDSVRKAVEVFIDVIRKRTKIKSPSYRDGLGKIINHKSKD